jgi:hypothetical protein
VRKWQTLSSSKEDFKSHIAAKVRATKLRAPSHTRLRALDRLTSRTLIGGKRRSRSTFAGLTLRLRDPMEGVSACVHACKMDVKIAWILTWHQMDHVSWSPRLLFWKATPWRIGRPWHSKISSPLIYYILLCVKAPIWIADSMK